MLITSALISGIGLGSMYGLLALGFYITYSVSNTVNFSQGSSMMLGAVFTYAFVAGWGWPLPLARDFAALALFARPTACWWNGSACSPSRRGSNVWLMTTVAIGIIADNVRAVLPFGNEPRGFPTPAGGLTPLSIEDPRGRVSRPCKSRSP